MYKIVSFQNQFKFNLIPHVTVDSHEQVLTFWQDALAKGLIKSGATLIHVDTHSDIYLGYHPAETTRANFINEAIKLGIISKVIWVVPDNLPKVVGFYSNTPEDTNLGIFNDVPFKATLYSDTWSLKMHESLGVVAKKIDLEIVRAQDLSTVNSDNIILDVDYDYFSNNGYDTYWKFKVYPTEDTLVNNVDTFFQKIVNLNIQPQIISASKSFEYVNVHQRNLLDGTIRKYLE